MEKKLPKVFANKIEKNLTNNNSYYVAQHNDNIDRKAKDDINVNQKIRDIFSSTRYVYKADVIIETKEGKTKKRIIGKNDGSLITIDNELIPISDIKDIYFEN